MGSSNTLTYDQTPPRRPSIDDVGGGLKENETPAPDPVSMLTAEDENQQEKLMVAAHRLLPLAIVQVTFTGGVPSVTAAVGLGTGVDATDFTATDNANGDTTISWPSALMPAVGMPPRVWQTDDIEIDRVRALATSFGGNPAVRVKTKLAAVGTDCNFALEIF